MSRRSGRNESPERLVDLQQKVDKAKDDIAVATALSQKAVDERKELEAILKQVTAREDKAQKELADQQAMVKSYLKAAKERASNVGKSILEMPILDAFNSPLKPANRWLPHCRGTTISATSPASIAARRATWASSEPCPVRRSRRRSRRSAAVTVELATPEKPPLVGAYGIEPAKAPAKGEPGVVIDKVRPNSLAADAQLEDPTLKPGLKAKDAVRAVNKTPVESAAALEEILLAPGNWEKPFQLSVHRIENGKPVDFELTMSPASLPSLYGLQLASKGVFSPSDVTIAAVYPRTPAAAAGLMGGDVIAEISGGRVERPAQVTDYLLAKENWGKSLKLAIRRGVPEPYTTHPRLDLFVGSLSPHPVAKFGCTICHQGQGSATAFKWASHTPNSLDQANDWSRDQQWFNNENWTYPMYPHRFEESTCLKCHHDVVELERSREYPDPPAPKVVAGYEIIRRYGCFGCHEINGFDGKRRIGPDLRLEPNYSAAAAQLTVDPGLEEARQAGRRLGRRTRISIRITTRPASGLLELLGADKRKPLGQEKADDTVSSRLAPDGGSAQGCRESLALERKVGPSLRHVGEQAGLRVHHKLDRESAKFPPQYANAAVLRPMGSSRRRRAEIRPSDSSRSKFGRSRIIC